MEREVFFSRPMVALLTPSFMGDPIHVECPYGLVETEVAHADGASFCILQDGNNRLLADRACHSEYMERRCGHCHLGAPTNDLSAEAKTDWRQVVELKILIF
mmetsp:Transcript_1085/g.2368  ORF Transcript_1085/g.2368 Transcript_1085/m.2368 type:complete len:102 (-) Transcript_1085:238-543(-)